MSDATAASRSTPGAAGSRPRSRRKGNPAGRKVRGAAWCSTRVRIWSSTAALLVFALCAAPAGAQVDPLAPIAELVRRHADREALEALAGLSAATRAAPRTRYLVARLHERLGQYEDAADALAGPLNGLPEAVQQDALRRRAGALARTGRAAEARALLLPLASRDPLLQAQAAECALAAGELEAAVTELRAVVARGAAAVDLFAARLQLGEALARTGARDEAIEVLTALTIDRPAHPEAALALQTLEALQGHPPTFTFEQRMTRAAKFDEQRRYDEALAELALAEPASRADRMRWLHLKGMALYKARRRYAEAAEVLAESARLGGPHAAVDQFHAARALSRANRDREAVTAYRRFARQHRNHARTAEALYLAAWLALRHDMPGAERQMRSFLSSAHARQNPELARDARWMLALRAFERGQHARAAELFEGYAESHAQTLVRARGLYWLGRARHAQNDRRRAIAAYRQAMEVEPLHWYALLARQRLLELDQDPGPPFPEPPVTGDAPSPPEVTLPEEVTFFAGLGLRHEALEALRKHERALRRQAGGDGLHALVEAYRALDEPARLRQLAYAASLVRSRNAPGPRDRWRWEAAYPRPWPERVQAAARAVGLTPAHLYAVMWQESGFDPDAVSYADAMGLMQLIPPTATRVAEMAGVELRREQLFDPTMNIRLGATYVGGLAEQLGVPLCFAGFNGGGHRVAEWLTDRGETELDLFVEHIPFTQTRNYVRRVTSHLAHYLYLEGDGGWPALELPRTVAPPGE